jgi:hypothetical protein
LWERISEVFDEINTGCLSKIETASAKTYLVSRWRKWKGLDKIAHVEPAQPDVKTD